MNDVRRKSIRKIIKELDNIIDRTQDQLVALNIVIDDERDAFNNLPEGIQTSDRGSEMEDNIEIMDEANDKINEAIDLLIDAMNELESNFF